MSTTMDRRMFLRLGLGAGGSVALMAAGGRAMAGPEAFERGASRIPAEVGPPAWFGRMFPHLPPFSPGATTSEALTNIGTLADAMLEPGGGFDTTQGAVTTYLGQFIAHDMTLDLAPQPSAFFSFTPGPDGKLKDPTGATVFDFESKAFDLSSIYGGGPHVSPQLYASDRVHFLVPKNVNGVLDLPRNADGSAIIVEKRNDENQITSQLMVAFLLFHNAIADTLGTGFAATQRLVIQYYNFIIANQFMPTMFGTPAVTAPSVPSRVMPVEFTVAAYRFGHSMVRNAYSLNPVMSPNNKPSRNTLFTGVGGATGPSGDGLTSDLHGGYPLPASHVIDWGNFVNALYNASTPGQSLQVFKQIGSDGLHMVGQSMFGNPPGTTTLGTGAGLPVGSQVGAAAPSGSNSIAYRDLVRAYFYQMPSGQEVASALGVTPLDPTTVISPSVAPGFTEGTPLWFYVMYETFLQNQNSSVVNDFDNTGTAGDFNAVSLGPVGAAINTSMFRRLMARSVRDGSFTPRPPIAPAVGQFGIEDLLVFAGVAKRP